MKGFQSFKKFKSTFEYDAGFNKLPKWDLNTNRNVPKKVKEETTFEYISPENSKGVKGATDALDLGKKISIKTPMSVRYTDDNTLNEQLPYNLSTTEDDIIHPEYVESTCIDSWDYDPVTLDLDVYFAPNPTKAYRFPNVPKSVVKRWIYAPSKGQFYWRVIRRYSVA